jgi:hypothetical protein
MRNVGRKRDYLLPASFGNLELKPRIDTEFIGQPIDYSAGKTVAIQIDSPALPRVDLIDVQGMEFEPLDGAQHTIEHSGPIIIVESIKAGRERARL